jgi:SRSO17 transposase
MGAEISPEAWIVDDTGFPKAGRWSVGVARQYCGALGKVANCQVGVSVSGATDEVSCPLDWRIFTPPSGTRMRSAGARRMSPMRSATSRSGSSPSR